MAQETFAGGILTNTVGLASGSQLTVNATDTVFDGTLTATGDIASDTSLSAPTVGTYTLNVTGTASIPSLTLTSGMTMGSITTLFAAFGTSATTHTITSTQLSWLGNNNWSGELKLFADDVSGGTGTNAGISILYLAKPSTTLYVTQGSKATSMGTFTTTFTNTTLTVTLSNSCRLCWIFTGAT